MTTENFNGYINKVFYNNIEESFELFKMES